MPLQATEAPKVITEAPSKLQEAVLYEALTGLASPQKTLTPWLFYDARGSQLFEEITGLPEYYLTRTERGIFALYAEDILLKMESAVTIAELGAGSAAKTGVLLQVAARFQSDVLYQPIDVSPTALDEAAGALAAAVPGVRVEAQVANYITEPYSIRRPLDTRVLALYIGSSIGNFTPQEAGGILRTLRGHLAPGDALLLGVDLAPSAEKPVGTLLAAYDDAAGVTAAFNLNVLVRLNRELDANFNLDGFAHQARWNAAASRIEMHLESLIPQTVVIAGRRFEFAQGETIHTENSYKFTPEALNELLEIAGFLNERVFLDLGGSYAVTLARAV